MKKFSIVLTVLSIFALSSVAQSIEWLTIEEAQKRAKVMPKKVLIDVYTDWCGWCKKMDNTTFKNAIITDYIVKNYYAVKFNAEQNSSVSFKGQEYNYVSQGRSGYNELAALLLNGKMAYPSIVFLDEQMNSIQPVPGYQTPETLDKILKYFAGDHHKTTDWQKFEKKYKSPF